MYAAGTFYKASGLIKPNRLLLAIFGGISLSVLIGWLFYTLTSLLSFVYLNFLLLFAVVVVSVAAYTMLSVVSKNRHPVVNMFLYIVCCYLAWSSQWSFFNMRWNYGYSFLEGTFNPAATFQIIARRMVQIDTENFNRTAGRYPFSGSAAAFFYVTEFIAFMSPLIFITEQKRYYCEGCDVFHQRKDAYVTATAAFLSKQEGDATTHLYRFLPDVSYYSRLAPTTKKAREIIRVTIHYCPKCLDNNIICVSTFEQQPGARNKNMAALDHENKITDGMYIEKDLAQVLIRKFA
ncbi:hypothetical protein [Chitinophaga rhizophila]|uniref:Uncharacterized protein n=1 Tax=Chitinophaga rhizophila TaxID=2866212 RepID=A0ABS7GH72_9BACT|nr:hypothetical protein [Chitinophaga rhizophila]MBW8687041.1 hypothetical protein [Chitinophaga rhizophila]